MSRELRDADVRAPRERVLVGEFAGAAGTLASLETGAMETQAGLCAELGLAQPVIAWHTIRDNIARFTDAPDEEVVKAAQRANGPVDKLTNPTLVGFINRNYGHDGKGNKMSAMLGAEKAEQAIKDGVAKKGY